MAETQNASSPVAPVNMGQVLFVGRALNFQLTTDQQLTKIFAGTNYKIMDVISVRKTGGASVACAGGIYDTASKGGNALVGVAQSWVTLAASVNVTATLAALVQTTLNNSATVYLSLTTGSTTAVTADVFIFGYVLD